ncbi:hypothetical protein BaRGS_00007999 [Batillaria attramentaria]|uniref:Uncharacterized protein n=1 Tax=Batillaria attramentaria TaxID=370345 RepID=A0ABD0LMV2_9CAEN
MRRAAARWRGGSWRWRLPVLRWAPSLARWLPTLTWRRGNVLGFVVSVWVCLITLVQLSLQPNKLLQVGDSGQVRGHAAFVGGVIDIGTQGLGQNWAAVDDGRSIITGVDLPRHAARHRSRASHDTTKRVVHHGEMVKVVENLDGGHFPDFERSRRRIQEIGSRQADNVDVSLAGAFQFDDAFGSNVESEEDSNPPSPSSASLSRLKSATHDEGQASRERYTLTDHQSQIPRPDSPSSQSQPLTHIRHVINPSLHSQAGRNSGRAASPGYESDLPQEQLDQEKFHQRKKVQGTDSRIGSSHHEFANAADRQSSRPGGVPKGVPGSTNRSTMDASRQGQGNSPRSSRAGNSPWSASVTSRVEEDQVVVVGTRLKQDGFLEHAYNVTASDLLPLDRDVPDTRPPG